MNAFSILFDTYFLSKQLCQNRKIWHVNSFLMWLNFHGSTWLLKNVVRHPVLRPPGSVLWQSRHSIPKQWIHNTYADSFFHWHTMNRYFCQAGLAQGSHNFHYLGAFKNNTGIMYYANEYAQSSEESSQLCHSLRFQESQTEWICAFWIYPFLFITYCSTIEQSSSMTDKSQWLLWDFKKR